MNEQQLRNVIRQVIREQKATRHETLLREYDDDYYDYYGGGYSGGGGKLYKAFVFPIVDEVGKALKLTSQDFLNSFKLIFKTLITISPKKLADARKEYTTTRDSLSKEWDPLMKKARASVEDSDFGIATFALAPNLFFGYQIGKFAIDAPETIIDYFDRAGWEVPMKDLLGRAAVETDVDRIGSGRGSDRSGESGSVGDKIRIFFFGESASKDGDLLSEADDSSTAKPVKITGKNINVELNKYFEKTGFDKQLDELASQMIVAKKKHAEQLLSAAKNQIDTLKSLAFSAAKDLGEFEEALSSAKSSGADIDAIQKKINELKQDLEKKSLDLKKDKKFKEDIVKKSGKKDMTDDDIAKAADNAAIEASKQALGQIKESLKASIDKAPSVMKKQIRDELMEDMPDEKSAYYKAVMSSAKGKEMMDVINDAVDAVNSIGASGE